MPPAASYEAAKFPTLEEQQVSNRRSSPSSGTAWWAPTSNKGGRAATAAAVARPIPKGQPTMTDLSLSQPATAQKAAPPAKTRGMSLPTHWLGVAPFCLFALMFLILPTAYLVIGAFQTEEGRFTLENLAALTQPTIVAAYWISIKVSLASAVLGALIGVAIAIAIVRGGLPEWIRSATLTFSGVASNFAGVPLAFAFLATLGRLGLVTVLLKTFGSTSMPSGSTSSPSGA